MADYQCIYLECVEKETFDGFCEIHKDGGVFGRGETFAQYEIIEQDFLNFIRIVPIDDPKHLSVYSHVLRDIIIRTCTEIEIFFKEFSKYNCSYNNDNPLWKEYCRNGRKERNWSFGSYHIYKNYRGQ